MMGRAIVIGGSIGGLFAASMLRLKGWHVDVYERSPVELAGRGAGIVTHQPLLDALELCGAGTKDLGITIRHRTAFDRDGQIDRQIELPQLVTSWDRLRTLTRATIPDDHHHLGHVLDRFQETSDGVCAYFTNGATAKADLLVAADGFRSSVRGHLLPEVQPEYAGYVVWRGVADEGDLPQDIRDEFFEHFGFFLPEDGEALGYPIAGADDDVRPGRRRYNWVWYRVVPEDMLIDMLTDEAGVAHDISIPPPLIRKEIIQKLRLDAQQQLSEPFHRVLEKVPAPFFTPIYDLASPVMTKGRVALVGDAAFVARPHIGAGVTKAAEDARSLAEALAGAASVPEGLTAFNNDRFAANRAAYDQGQYLGEYLMPKYTNSVEKADWAGKHNLDSIMRDTAVLNF